VFVEFYTDHKVAVIDGYPDRWTDCAEV